MLLKITKNISYNIDMGYLKQILCFDEKEKKDIRVISISTFISTLLTSYLIILNNNVFADSYAEGNVLYDNADWHLSLGRWATRFINGSLLNVVNPFFNYLFSVLCLSIGTFCICKLLNIEKGIHIILISIVMSICPAVVWQYEFMYILNGFSLAYLLSTLSVLSISNKRYFIGSLSLALCLGCYQAYVGMVMGLIVFDLILSLLNNDDLSFFIEKLKKYFIFGILGCILYLLILKVNLIYYKVDMSNYGGADKLGILYTLKYLLTSILKVYSNFLSFYSLTRYFKIIYYSSFIIIFLSVILAKKRNINKLISLVLMMLIPLAFDFVTLIAPERPTYLVMLHQRVLVIAFAFYMVEKVLSYKIIVYYFNTCVMILCLFFGVRAYATHYTISLMGDFYKTYIQNVISSVYNTDDVDKYPILFAGVIDENQVMSDVNRIFSLSYAQSDLLCYDSSFGIYNFWRPFTREKLGFDMGKVTIKEYEEIVQTQEFRDMEVYPKSGSIKMINGVTVVKIEEDPPLD